MLTIVLDDILVYMIKLGLDSFVNSCPTSLRGSRVALVAHSASVTTVVGEREHAVSILQNNPDIELVRLFGPEHGLYGHAIEGQEISDGLDEISGLPVISLYGERRAPTAEQLEDIDALIFDLQDIGVRCFTYISTLKYCMAALKDANKELVVLDRPNPLGRGVYGGLVEPGFESFVSKVNVPFVHGMTMGEIAAYLAKGMGFDNLTVVKMQGWQGQPWDQLGLQWVAPSPSMVSFEKARAYPISVFFEGTNLSEGRGTELSFLQFGAPWLNTKKLAETLNKKSLGVGFEETRFTPDRSKYSGEQVNGLKLVLGGTKFDPINIAYLILKEIYVLDKEKLVFLKSGNRHFIDLLYGSSLFRTNVTQKYSGFEQLDFLVELLY